MRYTLVACRMIFRAMAKEGDARTAGVAQEMLALLDSAICNLVEDSRTQSQ